MAVKGHVVHLRAKVRSYLLISGHHVEHIAVVVYASAELLHMHSAVYSLVIAMAITGVITTVERVVIRRRKWIMRHRDEYERSRRTKPTRGGIA